MALSSALLTMSLVPFQLTPFLDLGASVDDVDFSNTSFVETGRNGLFVVGALETQGGRFLTFFRTDGTQGHTVRQIELITSRPGSTQTFDVETTGSCEWLKKKLSLSYGAPVLNEVTENDGYRHRKIQWHDPRHTLVVSYWEATEHPLEAAQDCGTTAEVIE